MIDIETQARLKVSTDGDAGPYLMVPLGQLPEVTRVLSGNGIRFSVDDDAIELDGKAAIAVIDFGRSADVRMIQGLLDAAA